MTDDLARAIAAALALREACRSFLEATGPLAAEHAAAELEISKIAARLRAALPDHHRDQETTDD